MESERFQIPTRNNSTSNCRQSSKHPILMLRRTTIYCKIVWKGTVNSTITQVNGWKYDSWSVEAMDVNRKLNNKSSGWLKRRWRMNGRNPCEQTKDCQEDQNSIQKWGVSTTCLQIFQILHKCANGRNGMILGQWKLSWFGWRSSRFGHGRANQEKGNGEGYYVGTRSQWMCRGEKNLGMIKISKR
jgi:hypothetical protein